MKAFPTVNWVQQQGQPPNDEGMDLRDYFAAKTMQALINSEIVNNVCEEESNSDVDFPTLVAHMAYDMADTMMAAREKKNG